MNLFADRILGEKIYVYYLRKGVIHEYEARAPWTKPSRLDSYQKTYRVTILRDYSSPKNRPLSLAIPLESGRVVCDKMWLSSSDLKVVKKCFVEAKREKIRDYERRIKSLKDEIINLQ